MSSFEPGHRPPEQYPGQPPMQYPAGYTYPEKSQATSILVIGILGLVLCQVLSPVAWIMGNQELAAVDAGRRSPENRQTASIGRILGIVGTVLVAIALLLVAVAVIVLVATASSEAVS